MNHMLPSKPDISTMDPRDQLIVLLYKIVKRHGLLNAPGQAGEAMEIDTAYARFVDSQKNPFKPVK